MKDLCSRTLFQKKKNQLNRYLFFRIQLKIQDNNKKIFSHDKFNLEGKKYCWDNQEALVKS